MSLMDVVGAVLFVLAEMRATLGVNLVVVRVPRRVSVVSCCLQCTL